MNCPECESAAEDVGNCGMCPAYWCGSTGPCSTCNESFKQSNECAYRQGVLAGRDEERIVSVIRADRARIEGRTEATAEIVAWLREQYPGKYIGSWEGLTIRMVRDVLRGSANAIERGEHESQRNDEKRAELTGK